MHCIIVFRFLCWETPYLCHLCLQQNIHYYGVWTDALQETEIFGSSTPLTEVLCTSSSKQPRFEPMTSRLWTALSCPCDTRLTTELYGIFKRNVHVLPHYLWGLTWACAGLSKWCTGNWHFWLKYDRQKYYTPKFNLTGVQTHDLQIMDSTLHIPETPVVITEPSRTLPGFCFNSFSVTSSVLQ